MKIATRIPIDGLSGEVISHPDGSRATFGSCAIAALLHRTQRDREIFESGLIAYALASRISRSDFIELTRDEADDLKRRVAGFPVWNNLVVGRMVELMEVAEAHALAPATAGDIMEAVASMPAIPLRKE